MRPRAERAAPSGATHGSRCAPLIQWIDGAWRVHEDGAALLASVRGPLCVVACAGLYRTGKSFFLNALAGQLGERAAAGFRVGATSQSCTRGIDVCIPQMSDGDTDSGGVVPACGGTLVLLDSEGIASLDQDETYDAQIFSLGLLLSSYFVLNSMGVIDEAAIDRLFLITQVSKRVCAAANEASDGGDGDGDGAHANRMALSKYFPPLLWLLRDSVLELTDADGKQLTPSAYMEAALEPRAKGARRSGEHNETRQAIRELFLRRSCATLVRPAASEEEVRQAVTSSALRPEFKAGMGAVRASVLGEAPLKRVNNTDVDGPSLVLFAKTLVQAMNTPGTVPSIPTAWSSVVATRCREASDSALAALDAALTAGRSTLPPSTAWAHVASVMVAAALAAYERDAISDGTAADRRAELLGKAVEAVRAHGETLQAESLNAAVRAREAALGAAQLNNVRILGGVLSDNEGGGDGGEDGSFTESTARLCLEFEGSMPLGPATYEGAAPFATAVAAAADQAAASAAMTAERLLGGLRADGEVARTKAAAEAEVGVQLRARVAGLEEEVEGVRSELTEVRAELGSAREATAEGAAALARSEAVAEGTAERLAAEVSRREEENEAWKGRLAEAEAKAEEAMAAEVSRGAATAADLQSRLTASEESEKEARAEGAAAARAAEEREGADRVAMAELRAEYEAAREQGATTAAELQEAVESGTAFASQLEATRVECAAAVENGAACAAELEAAVEARERYKAMVTESQVEMAKAVAAEEATREAAAETATALADAVASEAGAREAAAKAAAAAEEERSAAEKSAAEERDLLKKQLAHFHERAALLPERYSVHLFSTDEVPARILHELASKPSVGAEELAGTAENLAEGHLGNIAAVASIGLRKVTPLASSWLSSYFGSAEPEEEEKEKVQPTTRSAPQPAAAAAAPAAPAAVSEGKVAAEVASAAEVEAEAVGLPPPPSSLPPPPSETIDVDLE